MTSRQICTVHLFVHDQNTTISTISADGLIKSTAADCFITCTILYIFKARSNTETPFMFNDVRLRPRRSIQKQPLEDGLMESCHDKLEIAKQWCEQRRHWDRDYQGWKLPRYRPTIYCKVSICSCTGVEAYKLKPSTYLQYVVCFLHLPAFCLT